MNIARKIAKWTSIALAVLLLLPILLMSLLYIPKIQNWAVQKAIGIASESTGLDISLDKVSLTFLLDIELDNLTAKQEEDTLLHTGKVIIDLDFSEVFNSHIGIETIEIQEGAINSLDLIPQLHINGQISSLVIGKEDTDIKNGIARLSEAAINGCDLDICMRDTSIVDTTESAPIPWSILIGRIDLLDSRISFRMPGDTLMANTGINQASLYGGKINLGDGRYEIDSLRFHTDSLLLAMKDSLGGTAHFNLPSTSLEINALMLDTARVTLPYLAIQTLEKDSTSSRITGHLDMDFKAFIPESEGHFTTSIEASISHTSILEIAKDLIPTDLARAYPQKPIHANLSASGNIESLLLSRIEVSIPSTFDLNAEGCVTDIMNPEETKGHLHIKANTMDMSFIPKYLRQHDLLLPSMTLEAEANINGKEYAADVDLTQGKGHAEAHARINLDHMAYEASLQIDDLNIQNFLPKDSLGCVSLKTDIKGHGTNIMSKATGLKFKAKLDKLEYKNLLVDNVALRAQLKRGRASLDLLSNNDLLVADACAEANLNKEDANANFSLSLNKINFHALGITKDTLNASMSLSLNGRTDLKQKHHLNGNIHNTELATKDTVFYPLDIMLEVKMDEQRILARANAGDMWIQFHAKEGLDSLTYKFNRIALETERQINQRKIDPDTIKGMLPHVDMHLLCGTNNPLANMMRSMMGATFNEMAFDLISNPTNGINGQGYMHKLNTAAVCLDSISWHILHENDSIDFSARVKNGPKNKVVNFESMLSASISPQGLKSHLLFLDAKGNKGVDFGAKVENVDSITQLSLYPLNPILAYRKFKVNPDNHISLDQNMHVMADMSLLADDGTALKLYTTPNENAKQDISLSIAEFNLGELSKVVPFMPVITGMLNGDIHAVQESEQATLSLDMDVRKMGFEGSPLGDIGIEMVYFPNADGSHLVDGVLSQNQRDVIFLSGQYQAEGEDGSLDAEARLKRLPLNMANGFITDNMARLEGYVSGILKVRGDADSPRLSGALATDSMHICSDPYSIDLRLPDDTIVIRRSLLDLRKIQAYANGNNPLTLDGTIDFSDLEQAKIDLSLIARDFNLINAPKRKGAEAYGKVYVDLYGRMQGTLNNLDIRGRLNVNGKTNVTYVMTDSPLTVDDQLSSLVTFTDFSDTIEVKPTQMPEQNIKMDFQLHIDEATTIHCLVSEDGQDKIDLEGGGELRMTYDMLNGMKLFGRYTILSGEMDYNLVVVSLKDFKIDNGSYVEFSGDMLDPKLNLSASERKKASVTTNNVSRTVNFDVGLKITQSLSDLGLEFTLKAPEDLSVQNEISAMSVEERGRAAVTMLTTGMYLSPNGSGGGGSFDATSALNSFLNSQISNIAGKALSTIDIGFGIDNSTSATGAAQTDYNFSFAKRFWGNRIGIIVGGKVSSGNDAQNTGMSIIDNVSIEYRLDNSGTRYVKAFYNKDAESLLDAEVMEMGASLVLRKKTENLGELFIFRDTKKKQAQQNKKNTPTTTRATNSYQKNERAVQE